LVYPGCFCPLFEGAEVFRYRLGKKKQPVLSGCSIFLWRSLI
jgi:hypothetical protein